MDSGPLKELQPLSLWPLLQKPDLYEEEHNDTADTGTSRIWVMGFDVAVQSDSKKRMAGFQT